MEEEGWIETEWLETGREKSLELEELRSAGREGHRVGGSLKGSSVEERVPAPRGRGSGS